MSDEAKCKNADRMMEAIPWGEDLLPALRIYLAAHGWYLAHWNKEQGEVWNRSGSETISLPIHDGWWEEPVRKAQIISVIYWLAAIDRREPFAIIVDLVDNPSRNRPLRVWLSDVEERAVNAAAYHGGWTTEVYARTRIFSPDAAPVPPECQRPDPPQGVADPAETVGNSIRTRTVNRDQS